jgi:WD40 repeat protein
LLSATLTLLQCHRRNEEGTDVVFPVNSIAYHPLYGTFATGGGDGVVNIWDGGNKKRLFQVRPFMSLACCSHWLKAKIHTRRHEHGAYVQGAELLR